MVLMDSWPRHSLNAVTGELGAPIAEVWGGITLASETHRFRTWDPWYPHVMTMTMTWYWNPTLGPPPFLGEPSYFKQRVWKFLAVDQLYIITWPWTPLVTIQLDNGTIVLNKLLVGGRPTPLKNDGVRQLGWLLPIIMESHKIHVPKHQPNGISSSLLGCKRLASHQPRCLTVAFRPLLSSLHTHA